jgi:hypothetical protein
LRYFSQLEGSTHAFNVMIVPASQVEVIWAILNRDQLSSTEQ